jgi:hypothetical protein
MFLRIGEIREPILASMERPFTTFLQCCVMADSPFPIVRQKRDLEVSAVADIKATAKAAKYVDKYLPP